MSIAAHDAARPRWSPGPCRRGTRHESDARHARSHPRDAVALGRALSRRVQTSVPPPTSAPGVAACRPPRRTAVPASGRIRLAPTQPALDFPIGRSRGHTRRAAAPFNKPFDHRSVEENRLPYRSTAAERLPVFGRVGRRGGGGRPPPPPPPPHT